MGGGIPSILDALRIVRSETEGICHESIHEIESVFRVSGMRIHVSIGDTDGDWRFLRL